MKVVYIIPGSGGTFYCQNCMRDNILAAAMQKAGHEVVIVPMYLPMFSDNAENAVKTPIFYGAVNLYLKYRYPVFRKFPDWMMRAFDNPLLLKMAAKGSGSTKSAGLEGMTLDILHGESGNMSGELEKMVYWLSEIEKPDIIHISNALLLGIVKKIKSKMDVKVVCSLQDEHQWVDTMGASFVDKVWNLVAEKAGDVDAFIAVSKYYASKMREKIRIPEEITHLVHLGIETDIYPSREVFPATRAVGYISKITEDLGFGILAEAFLILKQNKKFQDLKLYALGGMTWDNRKFIRYWQKQAAVAGWAEDFILEPDFDRNKRIKMLQKLSLLSVPVPEGEAFGTYLLEAMAIGVPVVQPDAGGFPEIINKTGGGIIYSPNDAETLATKLAELLDNKDQIEKLSKQAKSGVRKYFDTKNFVKETIKVYNLILDT